MASSLPPWVGNILLPIAIPLVMGAGGMYGGFLVAQADLVRFKERLDKIEQADRSEAWGGLVERVDNLEMDFEARAGDDQLRDWVSWRAVVDAWRTGVDVDIKDLQRRE